MSVSRISEQIARMGDERRRAQDWWNGLSTAKQRQLARMYFPGWNVRMLGASTSSVWRMWVDEKVDDKEEP